MNKTTYFGKDCISNLTRILNRRKVENLFAVTGKKGFVSSGARDQFKRLLHGRGVSYFNDFSLNPKIEDVQKGLFRFQQKPVDMVIAIGGGSVIDMAKLINIAAANPCNPKNLFIGKKKSAAKGVPLIAIPTTSGSGSEATHFAVVYIDQTKYSLADKRLMPDYCLVDPQLTHSMSPRLTAVSGFDAVCQAIESYWSTASNKTSRKYAARSIRLIRSALERAVFSPDETSRRKMALGAHLAGKAINITKTTGPHALSYPMTTFFNIPHGHAVAVLLGKFFPVNSDLQNNKVNDPRGPAHVRQTMDELCRLFDCGSPVDFQQKWYKWMDALGLEHDWAALGLGARTDRRRIVQHVNIERLSNNPVQLTEEKLKHMIGIDE